MNRQNSVRTRKVAEYISYISKTIAISVCIALLLWFMCSFFEVLSKNATENPMYSRHNAFAILVDNDIHLNTIYSCNQLDSAITVEGVMN